MERLEALLREREAQGLMRQYEIGGALAAVFAVAVYFATHDPTQRLIVTAAFAVPVGVTVVAWWLIRRRHFVVPLGFAFCIVTLGVLAFVTAMAYRAAGPDEVAASFLPKAVLSAVPAMLVAVTGFTLRPAYPLAMGAAAAALQAGFLGLALADPRTEVTFDNRLAVMGPKLDLAAPLIVILALAATGVIVALVVQTAWRTVRDGIRLQVANAQLARYFSPAVAARIAEAGGEPLMPGGREQDVVVLFSDIESFTRLTAGLSPGQALALLADYQARMVEAVFRHGGTLDKFVGDGIMATFGTPELAPDAADRAVAAALAMQQGLADLNLRRAGAGLPPVRHRIGLHAGPAIVGNVGTPERLEYTVIGETVNLASRIEQAGKSAGHSLLLSEAVKERLRHQQAPLLPLGPVALPGVAAPVPLYTFADAAESNVALPTADR